jgi:tRNA nucleotidyltransferase (CCA-adding enzyme)
MERIKYLSENNFDFTILPEDVRFMVKEVLANYQDGIDINTFGNILSLLPDHPLVREVQDLTAKELFMEQNNGFNTMMEDTDIDYAPNGEPSDLTVNAYFTVRWEPFKKWFGDWLKDPENSSKVIDSNGEPLMVWHGSPYLFNEFDETKQGTNTDDGWLGKGFYFSAVKRHAESYKYLKDKEDGKILSEGSMRPYFLNIRKLFNFDYIDKITVEDFIRWVNQKRIEAGKSAINIEDNVRWAIGDIEIGRNAYDSAKVLMSLGDLSLYLRERGYDGATGILEYVVFSPSQIKLADGHNQKFTESPDVRYGIGGFVMKKLGKKLSKNKGIGGAIGIEKDETDNKFYLKDEITGHRIRTGMLKKNGFDTYEDAEKQKNRMEFAMKFLEDGGQINSYEVDLNIDISRAAKIAITELVNNGRKCLIIGGAVRDALLGISPKDIDIEVYTINYRDLQEVLSKYGRTDIVGKAFGIIKFRDNQGNEYDFSLPRKESKIGTGHQAFDVYIDETMTPKEAAQRRDFTCNAIAYDITTGELHDYYGGVEDLNNKVLRATSEKFKEDPLRILRALQFQSRFGFDIHPDTMAMMREMVAAGAMDELPTERISEEWMKWATKGKQPSRIFEFIHGTGLNERLPHIGQLKGVRQEPQWHPEGDVEVHTGFVLDAAAEIADREGLKGDDRAVLIFSALTHDFAKPATTEVNVVDGKERITARGHEQAGGALAYEFLKHIGINQSIIDKVVPLVENHLSHVSVASIDNDRSKRSAIKRLAIRLKDANIQELLRLIEADSSGRPPLPKGLPESGRLLKELAETVGVQEKAEQDIVMGRHLIDLGMKPSRTFDVIFKAAKEAQINGEFTTEEDGINWVKNNFSEHFDKGGSIDTVTLYHGSDNVFKQFDPIKQSTGEGGDLFGKGFYLTDNKRVAEFYALQQAKKRFITHYTSDGILGSDVPHFSKEADREAKKHVHVNTFKVSGNFLDAENFVIDEKFKKGLAEVLARYSPMGDFSINDLDRIINYARNNHDKIHNYRGELEYVIGRTTLGDQGAINAVAEFIQSQGYDGIKYPSSKDYEGDGSYNYVIYSPDAFMANGGLVRNEN